MILNLFNPLLKGVQFKKLQYRLQFQIWKKI